MALPANSSRKGKRSNSTKPATASAAANTKKKKIDTQPPSNSEPLLASDFDESGYLKGLDIDLGEEELLTISEVSVETLGEGKDEKKKACLRFKEIEKGLILNKTNRTVLQTHLGNDMRRWPGHGVIVFSQMVAFKSNQVQSLRLRMPAPKREGGGSGLRRKSFDQKKGVAIPSSPRRKCRRKNHARSDET